MERERNPPYGGTPFRKGRVTAWAKESGLLFFCGT